MLRDKQLPMIRRVDDISMRIRRSLWRGRAPRRATLRTREAKRARYVEIVRRWRAGESVRAIAEAIGCSVSTVYAALNAPAREFVT